MCSRSRIGSRLLLLLLTGSGSTGMMGTACGLVSSSSLLMALQLSVVVVAGGVVAWSSLVPSLSLSLSCIFNADRMLFRWEMLDGVGDTPPPPPLRADTDDVGSTATVGVVVFFLGGAATVPLNTTSSSVEEEELLI